MSNDQTRRQPDLRAAREQAARTRALAGGQLLAVATRIIDEASRDWQRAPRIIARETRAARGLGSAERWLLGEMIHGWLRHRRWLEFVVGGQDVRAALSFWLRHKQCCRRGTERARRARWCMGAAR